MSCQNEIMKKILRAPHGTGFTASDFADVAEPRTVGKSLERLAAAGKIRRVMRGVYDRPRYSELLQEYEAPSPVGIAEALARNYHWTIVPSGQIVLNQLGLSTQVPAAWTFVSDGPYKSYQMGGITLRFKHSTNKNISGMSFKSAMVVRALKELGQKYVQENVIGKLRSHLTHDEKQRLYRESQRATAWMRPVIKKICEG